jgi:hypothetical protein
VIFGAACEGRLKKQAQKSTLMAMDGRTDPKRENHSDFGL